MRATIDLTGAADLHCHFGSAAHRERSVDALDAASPPPVFKSSPTRCSPRVSTSARFAARRATTRARLLGLEAEAAA
jgi:hypothetical protein